MSFERPNFPASIWALDYSDKGPAALEIAYSADEAEPFEDKAQHYISATALQGHEAIEVVATVLAGDPELAALKVDEAQRIVGALGEHFARASDV